MKKEMMLQYKDSLVPKPILSKLGKRLQPEILRMNSAAKKVYEDDRASINLSLDKKNLNLIKKVVKEKAKLKPEYLIVVGIGGSNLGAIAVQEAVLGKLHNQTTKGLKVLYADTVDSDSIDQIRKIMVSSLKKGRNVLLNAISKSGGTTETIANFELLLSVLKKYKKNYEKYVVLTTGKGSKFWNIGMKYRFALLDIPRKVGGRYSVFSAVGLFPLGLLGVDIAALLKGAAKMRSRCLSRSFSKNPAALSAALIFAHYKKGKNVHDLFLFANDLESVGKWYRQLTGESVGKEFDRKKKRVFNGVTPTVSVGSTDLHSMAQLYLGGPYDKFTSFVKVKKMNTNLSTPNFKDFDFVIKDIQKKPLQEIMDAIYGGVTRAFKKGKRPFIEFTLPDKSSYAIAQLLQLKMMEMMYLGFLMGVDPFDQPNVEAYKVETKKLLKR